jgi:hypothetical protein
VIAKLCYLYMYLLSSKRGMAVVVFVCKNSIAAAHLLNNPGGLISHASAVLSAFASALHIG